MLALYEKQINELKKVTIRYDYSTRTYYCFYHRTDNLLSKLILSYNLNENKWTVDSIEYKNLFEKNLNDLFYIKNIPFEVQIRYVTDYLDTYFTNQSQQQKQKVQSNIIHNRIYSLPWLQRLCGIRRCISQDILKEPSAVLQRYSAPERSINRNSNEQIISVKALAETFYANNIYQNCTKTFKPTLDYFNEHAQNRLLNKAPPITAIWLDVNTHNMNDFQKNIDNHIKKDHLKKLAEKFVTYFGGTFQCNIGHKYHLEYNYQMWYFTVLKVEFLTNKTSETTKNVRTKIIFVINNISYQVRG